MPPPRRRRRSATRRRSAAAIQTSALRMRRSSPDPPCFDPQHADATAAATGTDRGKTAAASGWTSYLEVDRLVARADARRFQAVPFSGAHRAAVPGCWVWGVMARIPQDLQPLTHEESTVSHSQNPPPHFKSTGPESKNVSHVHEDLVYIVNMVAMLSDVLHFGLHDNDVWVEGDQYIRTRHYVPYNLARRTPTNAVYPNSSFRGGFVPHDAAIQSPTGRSSCSTFWSACGRNLSGSIDQRSHCIWALSVVPDEGRSDMES